MTTSWFSDDLTGAPAPMMKVLFLGATPDDQVRLRLDSEFREIRAKIQASKYRDQIQLVSDWAVRPQDLSGILIRESPHVVHFSGHGSEDHQLMFEDAAGNAKQVDPEALVQLFNIDKTKRRFQGHYTHNNTRNVWSGDRQ